MAIIAIMLVLFGGNRNVSREVKVKEFRGSEDQWFLCKNPPNAGCTHHEI